MSKLIKMDLYRLIRSKMMWICVGIMSLLQLLVVVLGPIILRMLAAFSSESINTSFTMTLSDQLNNPFQSFMLILVLISAVSFFYADLANGYIKNIAGQVPAKGYTAVSKFIVIIVHNLIFMCFGTLSSVLGGLISPQVTLEFDMDLVPEALAVFFTKLLLLLALCAILLFVCTALRSKTFASVLAVLFGVSALSLVYALINNLLHNISSDIDITKFVPDELFNSTVYSNALSSIAVAVVYIVVFLALAVKIFNSRDVK